MKCPCETSRKPTAKRPSRGQQSPGISWHHLVRVALGERGEESMNSRNSKSYNIQSFDPTARADGRSQCNKRRTQTQHVVMLAVKRAVGGIIGFEMQCLPEELSDSNQCSGQRTEAPQVQSSESHDTGPPKQNLSHLPKPA